MIRADKIIIGAGLYGLYAALYCAKSGQRIVVLECEASPFSRATYINQARVHMGYHYPRSLSTALKSAGYFRRFLEEFGFCIFQRFEQVYATSAKYSWTDAVEFKKFCQAAGIKCEEIPASKYFKDNMCDGAFLTEEYTYDAQILKNYFLSQLALYENVSIQFGVNIQKIERDDKKYCISTVGKRYESEFILNATYASVNQILSLMDGELFDIKYELCEIILCHVNEKWKDVGITVMDGPFFSIMPFGKTGYHSLTSVTFTPHLTSFDTLPRFRCQKDNAECTCKSLRNCNQCPAKPSI